MRYLPSSQKGLVCVLLYPGARCTPAPRRGAAGCLVAHLIQQAWPLWTDPFLCYSSGYSTG